MSTFGWSMPPGCSSTPFDEEGASDLKVEGLPADFGVSWSENGDIILQQFGGEHCPSRHLAVLEWDDEKDDDQNFEAARQAVHGTLQTLAPVLSKGIFPV